MSKTTSVHNLRLRSVRCSLIWIAIILSLAATTNSATGDTASGQEPQAKSQGLRVPVNLRFDVWMDDKPLGSHNYGFSRKSGLLQVDSRARFNVKVLFVNVFRYDHDARELWDGPCLASISSDTTTNGEEETLNLQFDVDGCAGTYTYWDKARLQRPELTNAQTGEQEPASWSKLEPASLPAPSKKSKVANPPADITHYRLTTASATFLLWYDRGGRCLAMQTTNDGRTITYMNRELR